MEKRIQLKDGWKLRWAAHEDVCRLGLSFKTVKQLEKTSLPCIKASVPGNFELDFQAAGLIEEPFYSDNIVKLRKYEDLHLWYSTVFDVPDDFDGQLILDFEGVDTVAEIFVNGELAEVDNMLIEHRLNFTDVLKPFNNSLVVHILPSAVVSRDSSFCAGLNAMQYEAGSLYLRKAASTFGWDIIARTISGGLWKPVYLVSESIIGFTEVYPYTRCIDLKNKRAEINVFYNFRTTDGIIEGRYSVRVSGRCGDSAFSAVQNVWHTAGSVYATIPDCRFWWPKNYGEPELYDLTVELVRDGQVVDARSIRFGVRTVELKRTSVERDENSDFCFIINGQRVFCLGTNWVPLDAYHSRDIKNLPRALELLGESGCNTVRCWGGNVYENNEFYDWCDSHGIMVWQDFGMGCAVYPQDEFFCQAIAEEAESVIKRLRNHACLILWAGDNECDYAYSWNGVRRDPNENVLTRRVLKDACRMHDVVRPYLPSSPYIDEEAYESGLPTTEDHLWGPRDYFKGEYYRTTVCHFASETGYHGCPAPDSLAQFIAPEQLWPMFGKDGRPNPDWVYHGTQPDADPGANFGYRTALMANQVRVLFRETPEDLDTFARMSQISQGEAMKYFIERFRISKPRRTGIIWWNLIDGWPQVSDAVVDYYGRRKLAFEYIKTSQQPVCLMFDEPVDGKIALYGVNDTQEDVKVRYSVKAMGKKIVMKGVAELPKNSSIKLGEYEILPEKQEFLLIKWQGGQNHYVTNIRGVSYARYRRFMELAGLDHWDGFTTSAKNLSLKSEEPSEV